MSYILNEMPKQINKKLVEKCSKAETATIGHIRNMGFADRRIQNVLNNNLTISGTAVTLAIPGQDSTLLHHVIQFLRPGDILCIDRFPYILVLLRYWFIHRILYLYSQATTNVEYRPINVG